MPEFMQSDWFIALVIVLFLIVGYFLFTMFDSHDEGALPAPHGEAVDALHWILNVSDDTDPANQMAFLRAWVQGTEHEEWPEYAVWLQTKDQTA